jgi:hypothetical protein
VYNFLNKLVRRVIELMKKWRDLLFAIFVIILNSSVVAAMFLINSSNWPFFKELWGKIPLPIIFFMLALITATGLTTWLLWRVIGRMDKVKDEQQIIEMKEAFKKALKEAGLTKEIEDKPRKGKAKHRKGKPTKRELTK